VFEVLDLDNDWEGTTSEDWLQWKSCRYCGALLTLVVLWGAKSGEEQGRIAGVWDGESNEGFVVEMTESFSAGEVMWGMLEGDKSSGVNGEEMIGKSRVSGNGLVKTHVVLLDALVERWG